MGQMKRLYVILCAILVLALPVSAVNSISAEIISPASAAPGDIISFEILVTNLAPVFLDHCNYIFSVGPYVDLIWLPCGGCIDELFHICEFWDVLACPPPPGESYFFDSPILGKIRNDTPPDSVIMSSFWIEIISEEGPYGEWCPGCWGDSTSASNFTRVDSPPVPVPEFPGVIFPNILLVVLVLFIAYGTRRT